MVGDAPNAPTLSCVQLNRHGNNEREQMLRLRWGPGSNSANVTFYVLETCGKEGSRTHRKHEYEEVYRDPPHAGIASGPKCEVKIESLEPNTRYFYRIRAFNGHGASPFTYGSFATAPRVPNCPIVVSKGSGSITLEWSSSKETLRAKREMRALFDKLAHSATGPAGASNESIALIDWLDAVDRDPSLATLLKSLKSAKGTPEHRSVYACLENLHDAEMLTWKHLENHLAEDVNVDRLSRSTGDGLHYVLSVCTSDEELAPIKGRGAEVCLAALKRSSWFAHKNSAPALSGTTRSSRDASAKPKLPNVFFVEAPDVSSMTENPPACCAQERKTV